MELLSNIVIVGPIGALVAIVVAFHRSFHESLSPYERRHPIFRWYIEHVTVRVPLVGLVSLAVLFGYMYTSQSNLLDVALGLMVSIIGLLLVAWLMYELENFSPIKRIILNWFFGKRLPR